MKNLRIRLVNPLGSQHVLHIVHVVLILKKWIIRLLRGRVLGPVDLRRRPTRVHTHHAEINYKV